MIHYGDICKIKGDEVPVVNIIVGGSPCQDLSIAGNRAGLDGARSGLYMEQIRIIKEMRLNNGKSRTNDVCGPCGPRFMVWENVQGSFTSNHGADFRCVLEEAARIADSSAVIPGPPDGWTNSGAVLGDRWSIAWRLHDAQFWGVPQRRRRIALVVDFGGHAAPEILFERDGVRRDIEKSEEPRGRVARTDGNGIVAPMSWKERCGKEGGGKGLLIQTEKTGTLGTLNWQPVCYGLDRATFNQGKNAKYKLSIDAELSAPIIARGPNAVFDTVVRRLTPLECERLQGFPDGWTDINEWTDTKGKKHKCTDTARYKALGNSIALPFWQWLAGRMVDVLKADGVSQPTMASLFDGIGGFPLVFSRCGCVPVWASEVEEFPIAVTKRHFPESEVES